MAVVSSITVEGKRTLGNVELKWKLEVFSMINFADGRWRAWDMSVNDDEKG